MNQFVLIPKKLRELDSKHRYLDIAVYFTIRCFLNGRNACISYKKIKEKIHINDRDIKTAITELKDNKLLTYRYKDSVNNDFVYNEYYFDKSLDKHFEMVGIDLLKCNLKAKQIGILIYLKLNSVSNWFRFKDYKELGSNLGVSRQTASKYINELSDFIEPSKAGGVHFINKIFTFKDKEETTKKLIQL